MTGSESYVLDAGWLFFAAWSLVVVTVSAIAFGKDLFADSSVFDRRRRPPTGKTHL
jgi:hypothetical protein